uniref:Uncharacterized protein n=1 Tax=Oryza rufipogon TaxID=4529 RepID=A0A0E0N753_ORYRU
MGQAHTLFVLLSLPCSFFSSSRPLVAAATTAAAAARSCCEGGAAAAAPRSARGCHQLATGCACGSLLHPRRLRFSVAPVAAAKPEAVGTTGEAAAAPVKELAKSLQGVELFDLRGKAVPVVDLWKDRNFLSCFGRLIVFETIDDGCLHVCALP